MNDPRAPVTLLHRASADKRPLVSIVVPMFNEGPAIESFQRSIGEVMGRVPDVQFEVVCIDDGSRDDTLERLLALAAADSRFIVIELSRNFGKEASLTAGLDHAQGDAVVPMDADLQDNPELLPRMIACWRDGADVVLARRSSRASDSLLKRTTARWFYRLHNRLSSVPVPENVGDFRLMDRAVVQVLKSLPERQRFMKGLFAWVGFRCVTLEYERAPRCAGDSKFSGWRLWNFALEGITSFSSAPLRVWTYVGLAGAIGALLYAAAIVLRTAVYGVDVPGYASLLVVMLFLGSLQLMSIGLVGEYIGRIYMEAKGRPIYVVRSVNRRRDAPAARSAPEPKDTRPMVVARAVPRRRFS